jgi:hypothetical protein
MIFNSFNTNEINQEIIAQYYQQILNEPLYFEKNNINELNHNGSSLLFYPVIWKNVPFIQLLINKGCDINIVNKNGYSSLTWADKEIFEIIGKNKDLNKEKILPSLITSINSSCFKENIFSLFLEIFEQEIIKLPAEQIQHINRAIFTQKEPLMNKWNKFCKSHNISSSIINVFNQHMLKFSNKLQVYVPNNNLSNSIDKQQAIDEYKSLYNGVKNKFDQFVVDLTEATKHNNQQFTDNFLLSSTIKKDMAQFLKPNEVWNSAISNQDIECGLYKKEIFELYELTKSLISGKSNKEGIPHYLLSDKYIKLLNNDWEKIHLEKIIDISPIQEVLIKYNLKCLVFDKKHNIDTLNHILNIGFLKISHVLKIEPLKIGQGELYIDCAIYETNENVLGSFFSEKNALWLNTNKIGLNAHIKDISQTKLNDLTSTFVHEYTHFLQYLNEPNPKIIFENNLKDDWGNIVNTINYKKYSKDDIHDIFITLVKKIMINEEVAIDNDKIDNLKLQFNEYFENNNSSSLKKIKSIIIKDTTKENEEFVYFKKMIELFKISYKKPEAFQEELWRNYDKVFNGKYDIHKTTYWSNPIEIHARLNQEIFLKDSSSMLDVGHFLSSEEKNDLIQLLKPKLEKFNQLLISHKEYCTNKLSEQKNKTKTIYKLF